MTDFKPMEKMAHTLNDVHRDQLRNAHRNAVDALAELGTAYLNHVQARAILEQAQMHLTRCEHEAEKANSAKARLVEQITKDIDLPDGQYVFDAEQGTFTARD